MNRLSSTSQRRQLSPVGRAVPLPLSLAARLPYSPSHYEGVRLAPLWKPGLLDSLRAPLTRFHE